MKSILFLSRTYMYTGENHNERGMNRKKSDNDRTVQLMNHGSSANF